MNSNGLDNALAIWVAVVGAFAIVVSATILRLASGDACIEHLAAILSTLELVGRYIYLIVLTGCIVWLALMITGRISYRRESYNID